MTKRMASDKQDFFSFLFSYCLWKNNEFNLIFFLVKRMKGERAKGLVSRKIKLIFNKNYKRYRDDSSGLNRNLSPVFTLTTETLNYGSSFPRLPFSSLKLSSTFSSPSNNKIVFFMVSDKVPYWIWAMDFLGNRLQAIHVNANFWLLRLDVLTCFWIASLDC